MYSRITASKNGREAMRYADGKGPGQHGRNVLVTTINMIPNGKYTEQMVPLWKKARANHKVQVRRIIISFSKNELDPNNEEDVEIANTIVREFIKTYYPDRQAALFFQRDGKGGCLHCHAIVNDISLNDHKGCTRTQQYFKYVRNGIDAVAAKFIELDDGGKLKSKQTHTERAKAEKAARIMNEHPELQGDELRQVLIEKKAYSYKEDMKERIHEAAIKSFDLKTFFSELKTRGIEAIKKISPKYGEHYVYDFASCPVGAKNTKARSYKLGYSFGPEAVKTIWQEQNKKKCSEGTDFARWMREQGKSCFAFDEQSRLESVDWEMWEELHEEYLKAKEVQAMSTSTELTETQHHCKVKTAGSKKTVKRKSVTKTNNTAVSQLLMGTEDIMRRLSAEQLSTERYEQAEEEFALSNKRQLEKSL